MAQKRLLASQGTRYEREKKKENIANLLTGTRSGTEDPRRGNAAERKRVSATARERQVRRGEIGEINKPGGGRETRFARGGGTHIEPAFLIRAH